MTNLITIHGAGMGPGVWDALAALVPLRALALPGHGDGAVPLTTIADMAAFTAQTLDAPCILMGHSMGGLVALEAAVHPLVKGIILLGCAAEMPVHPDLLKQAHETPETAAGLVLKWGVYGQNPVREALNAVMVPSALGADLAACNEYKYLKKNDKPALIICGDEDKMVKPAASAALGQLLTRSKIESLPATGHMMMAENPAEVAGFVQGFQKVMNN